LKILAALGVAFLLPASASAASFALFGSYWDTDALEEAAGGGIAVGFELSQVIDLEFRATYLEELTDEPLDALFDNDDPVFEESSIEVLPIDIGLRFNILRRENVNPYLGAGGTYYLLDSKRPGIEIDDEFGYYGVVGARFGDNVGPSFFIEALYRKVEGTAVNDCVDPDVGDIDFIDRVTLDLDGPSANAGIRWSW
jgi:hypothetical protein